MKLKKSAKNRKNEKTQHLIRCFKSKKQFQINLEQKVAKNVFFVIFSKTVSFGQKLDITNVFLVKFTFLVKVTNSCYQCVPREIPFPKMYTFMCFYVLL